METIDRQLLSLLAVDGRMSFTDLGRETGLSTSAVHHRVKRLEARGLIKGYGAVVDHDELGLPLTAFVSIRPIDPSQADDSPERLSHITEIESCWSVAGEESYILKVRVATPVALEDLLGQRVDHFCYPYGSHDLRSMEAAAVAGYLSGTTCERAAATPSNDLLALPRKAVSRGDDVFGVAWKLLTKNAPKRPLLHRAG